MDLLQLQRDPDLSIQTHQSERPGRPISKYRRLVTSLLSSMGHWLRQHTDTYKLQAMDDRSLKDIGLERRHLTSSIEKRIELETRSAYRAERYSPYR